MLKILKILWQLPQSIVALFVRWIYSPCTETIQYKGKTVYVCPSFRGGLCLGEYIFVRSTKNVKMIPHEYGHSRQSMMLGPLFLLIVGLPSIIQAGLANLYPLSNWMRNYYKRYPENWADKLGGVDR
jgi:hypothetical protein